MIFISEPTLVCLQSKEDNLYIELFMCFDGRREDIRCLHEW